MSQNRREPPSGLSVCIPAYNEADNLPAMIDDVVRVMSARVPRLEIVITDDGSTDGTAEALRTILRRQAGVRTVHHVRNLGCGAAARSALAVATQDVVLLTDADRQFELECIDESLAAIVACDMVVGFRAPRRDPPARVLAGRAWTALVNRLCGYAARDLNRGFKAVWRHVLARVIPALTARGATFSAEWLPRVAERGALRAGAPRPAPAADAGRRDRTAAGGGRTRRHRAPAAAPAPRHHRPHPCATRGTARDVSPRRQSAWRPSRRARRAR